MFTHTQHLFSGRGRLRHHDHYILRQFNKTIGSVFLPKAVSQSMVPLKPDGSLEFRKPTWWLNCAYSPIIVHLPAYRTCEGQTRAVATSAGIGHSLVFEPQLRHRLSELVQVFLLTLYIEIIVELGAVIKINNNTDR